MATSVEQIDKTYGHLAAFDRARSALDAFSTNAVDAEALLGRELGQARVSRALED